MAERMFSSLQQAFTVPSLSVRSLILPSRYLSPHSSLIVSARCVFTFVFLSKFVMSLHFFFILLRLHLPPPESRALLGQFSYSTLFQNRDVQFSVSKVRNIQIRFPLLPHCIVISIVIVYVIMSLLGTVGGIFTTRFVDFPLFTLFSLAITTVFSTQLSSCHNSLLQFCYEHVSWFPSRLNFSFASFPICLSPPFSRQCPLL